MGKVKVYEKNRDLNLEKGKSCKSKFFLHTSPSKKVLGAEFLKRNDAKGSADIIYVIEPTGWPKKVSHYQIIKKSY